MSVSGTTKRVANDFSRTVSQVEICRRLVAVDQLDPRQADLLGEGQDDMGRRLGQHCAVLRREVVSRPEWASAGVAASARSPASRIAFTVVLSSDALGPLEFPDVGQDRRHITAGQPLDRWHVPKAPVMGPDAPSDRPLKRLVAVVAGLVDDMDRRWRDPYHFDTSYFVAACSLMLPVTRTSTGRQQIFPPRRGSPTCR